MQVNASAIRFDMRMLDVQLKPGMAGLEPSGYKESRPFQQFAAHLTPKHVAFYGVLYRIVLSSHIDLVSPHHLKWVEC